MLPLHCHAKAAGDETHLIFSFSFFLFSSGLDLSCLVSSAIQSVDQYIHYCTVSIIDEPPALLFLEPVPQVDSGFPIVIF